MQIAVAAAIGVGGEIRDSMRGGINRMAQKMRAKRMEPRLPQVAPRRGQTMAVNSGLMGEINRSIEKMSIGDNNSNSSSMMNPMASGATSLGAGATTTTTLLAGGKLRGGNSSGMPPQSTLLQNTSSNRYVTLTRVVKKAFSS